MEVLEEPDDELAVRELAAWLRREEIDLVHAHMYRAEVVGTCLTDPQEQQSHGLRGAVPRGARDGDGSLQLGQCLGRGSAPQGLEGAGVLDVGAYGVVRPHLDDRVRQEVLRSQDLLGFQQDPLGDLFPGDELEAAGPRDVRKAAAHGLDNIVPFTFDAADPVGSLATHIHAFSRGMPDVLTAPLVAWIPTNVTSAQAWVDTSFGLLRALFSTIRRPATILFILLAARLEPRDLSLLGWERFRASQFGIRHLCTMGLNPKEANNARVADGVMELLRLYVEKDGVVAVGDQGGKEANRFFDYGTSSALNAYGLSRSPDERAAALAGPPR